MEPKTIAISVGEPAGIGPDTLIQIIQSRREHQLIAHADPDLLIQRANTLNLPLKLVDPTNKNSLTAGVLAIAPQKLVDTCTPGKLNERKQLRTYYHWPKHILYRLDAIR